MEVSLALLDSLHDRWIRLLRSLQPEDWKRTFRHPDLGPMTLEKNLAALRLARTPSRSPHHQSARKKRLGRAGCEEPALQNALSSRNALSPEMFCHPERSEGSWFLPVKLLRHPQLPQQIAASLPQHRIPTLHHTVRTRIRPRRNIDRTHSFMLQQFLNAKHMI